jgi:hypothetical protein
VDRRKQNKNIILLWSLKFLLLLTHYRSKFYLYINKSWYTTTTIIMKFCAAAVRLLFLGSCSLLTESVTNALADEDDKMILPTSNRIHRSLQRNNAKGGKKGNNNGGNKDCNRNAMELDTSTCPIPIDTPGRYVLPNDVQCATDVDGIVITADDVFLNCQDHIITGDRVAGITTPFGIRLTSSSSDVTITNCHATKFGIGILVDQASGSNIISDSSFYENEEAGGALLVNEPSAAVAIVNSHFDRNGRLGATIGHGLNIAGSGTATIISSTANGNIGNEGAGIVAFDGAEVSVWDSEISNNIPVGVIPFGATISVVKSIVCGNIDQDGFQNDIVDPSIAQAVTCDESSPSDIGGIQVCQCPCPAKYPKGLSGGGMQVSTESFITTDTSQRKPVVP